MKISAVVMTYNSEKHIADCVKRLMWVDEILVIDSGSIDRTQELAQIAGARVVYNPWPGYAAQRNFCLSLCRNDWVLMVDSDERVSPVLAQEINTVLAEGEPGDIVGYSIPTKHYFLGKWMRGWYPDRHVRLFRRSRGTYPNRRIHEAIQLNGKTACLKMPLYHYSFDNLTCMVEKFNKYSSLAVQEAKHNGEQFSLVKLLTHPLNAFVKMYIIKGGFRDGIAGLVFCVTYGFYVFLKYAKRYSEE